MKLKERPLAVYLFVMAAILTFTVENLLGLTEGMMMSGEVYGPALLTVAVLAWWFGPRMRSWIKKGDLIWRGAGGGALFVLASYAVAAPLIQAIGGSPASISSLLIRAMVGFLLATVALSHEILFGALAGIVFGKLVADEETG